MKPATLRDIARLTNLDVSTVSRVLNGDSGLRITAGRREEVLRVAGELGYVPHRSARALRLNRSFNVGYFLMNLEAPHARLRLYGMMETLDRSGYLVSLLRVMPGTERLDERALHRKSVEGLIWDCYSSVPSLDESLSRVKQPVVLLDPFGLGADSIPNASYVYSDRRQGVRAAMEYLRARGHRSVALVSAITNELRRDGYMEAVRELGMTQDARLVKLFGHDSEDASIVRGQGYHAARELLCSGVEFTAIQAGNDSTAAGVIDALREAGKRIPEDVAVVGYDDIETYNSVLFSQPFLTTVRDPNLEMGTRGAELLLAMIDQQAPPQRIWLAPELVIRGSA